MMSYKALEIWLNIHSGNGLLPGDTNPLYEWLSAKVQYPHC